MRLLWLVDELRAEGLAVNEYGDWRNHGASTFGPVRGVICHGTAGSLNSTDAGELRTIFVTGSTSAPAVPIAQIYLSRSGQVWVGASGTATGVRAGEPGTPLADLSDDAVVQIEAQHHPAEPWSVTQLNAYIKICAVLVRHKEFNYDVPVSKVLGHYEHQPSGKTDPWFDMVHFRQQLQNYLGGNKVTWDYVGDYPDRGIRNPIGYSMGMIQLGTNQAAWQAVAEAKAARVELAALRAVIEQLAGGNVDTQAILAGVDERLATLRTAIDADTKDTTIDALRGGIAAVEQD